MRRVARGAVALTAVALAIGPSTIALGLPITRPTVPVVTAASAAGGAESLSPSVTTAAWYQPDPLCSTPLGCGAIPLPALSPYPEGTFHVGAALGRQTARAFIGVPLSERAQTARGGTLSIPLDTNPADG